MSDTLARDVGVVIVAGGQRARARRAAELKQFRWVAGKPMLLHSLQTFMARADVVMVVCVLPQRYAGDPPPWIFQCDIDRLLIAPGGRTRTESVRNGLEDLPDEATIVLVHDAARPLVDDDDDRPRRRDGARGHVRDRRAAVVDTLKEVDDDGAIVRTVERDAPLARADAAGLSARDDRATRIGARRPITCAATDDAALCERLGIPVVVVAGASAR